ncbi:UNVERIFIED_CONTAM: putative mitochondrial protein [Sesamum calycinum]|uniref:Mitochondrial protein n=1 Tax=Sesamum calycinum TaxID=2727403 RepID=A0AAW2M0T2_9LAMI
MMDWPEPKIVKELQGFLGLTGYYRHFVKDYEKIAKPLIELLQQEGFTWTVAATYAFHALKKAVCNVPVLALPNFSKEFIIETNAFGEGIGAVLQRQGRPIAYISKALIGGHSGIQVTLQRIKQWLYWKGLKQDVHEFIKVCDTCQRCRGENVAYPSLLQPLPIPKGVWRDISLDFEFFKLQKEPPLHSPYTPYDSSTDSVDRSLQNREATLRLLKKNLTKARDRMKKQADKGRSEREFNVIQRIGKVVYRLDLPPYTKIHSTFHVFQLKKCHGDSVAPWSLPFMLTPHRHLVLEPEAILDRRIIPFHNRPLMQILVKWFNTPTGDNTWENYYEFMQKFPNFGP